MSMKRPHVISFRVALVSGIVSAALHAAILAIGPFEAEAFADERPDPAREAVASESSFEKTPPMEVVQIADAPAPASRAAEPPPRARARVAATTPGTRDVEAALEDLQVGLASGTHASSSPMAVSAEPIEAERFRPRLTLTPGVRGDGDRGGWLSRISVSVSGSCNISGGRAFGGGFPR